MKTLPSAILAFFLFLFITIFTLACEPQNSNIKQIIDEAYYDPITGTTQMKTIEKIEENIFNLQVDGSIVKKYFTHAIEDNEYALVRYIYKTNKGAHRRFYIIDSSREDVLAQSDNAADFYRDISTELLDDVDVVDIEGDNLMSIYGSK